MKTTLIKSILFTVGLIFLSKLIFGQTPYIAPRAHYFKPDSIMSDSMYFSQNVKVKCDYCPGGFEYKFGNIIKSYTYGESTHSNYNEALLLAHKELTLYAKLTADNHINSNYFDVGDCKEKYNLVTKKTTIELLDNGLYHVVIWGRYEISK
jgi:hypothetical protein